VVGAATDGGEFDVGDQAGALAVLVADDQPDCAGSDMTAGATSTLMSSRTCGPAASVASTAVPCAGSASTGRDSV